MNPAANLILIGPMGAGKSSVGRRLATHFDLVFVDLDHAIEQRTGVSIPLIFEHEGEAGFRRREHALVAEFSARRGILLSCGGGVVLHPANRALLADNGFVVWLTASVDEQLQRLAADQQRPLLATPDRRARLDALAAERDPLYAACADLAVSSSDQSMQHAAQRIAREVAAHWQPEIPA